jgi:hypothetical protein
MVANVTLRVSSWQAANPYLFGYNLETLGTMIPNRFDDTGAMSIGAALQLGTLRYPGGTMANIWDMREGRYVDPPGGWDYHGASYHGFEPFAKQINAAPAGTYSASSFLRGVGSAARGVMWCVNVYSFNTSEACDQFDQIAQLLGADAEARLELGNELYGGSQRVPTFPAEAGAAALAYAAAVQPLVACARKALPRAKVGNVGCEAGVGGGACSAEWMGGLAAALPLVDAVTIHDYSPRGGAFDKVAPADRMGWVLGYSRANLLASVHDAIGKLGSGGGALEVWMTEFNYAVEAGFDYPFPDLAWGGLRGAFHSSRVLAAISAPTAARVTSIHFQTFVHPRNYSATPNPGRFNPQMPVARIANDAPPDRPELATISGTGALVAHLAHLALRGGTMAAVAAEGTPNASFDIVYHAPQPCVQAAAFGGGSDGSGGAYAVLNICNSTVHASVAGAAPAAGGLRVTMYSALDAGGWTPLPAAPTAFPWADGPLHPATHRTTGPAEVAFDVPGLSLTLVEALE